LWVKLVLARIGAAFGGCVKVGKSMDGEREQLRPLTGARFIAALFVTLFHAEFILRFLPQLSAGSPLSIVLDHGHFGVDFFFLLSGFILSYSYRTQDGTLRGGARSFWVARFARIYPVYVLGLLVGLVPFLMGQHDAGNLAIISITTPLLLQTWVPAINLATWNGPSWSLSNEALFYLLFPLLLTLLTSCKRHLLLLIALLSWWAVGLLPALAIQLATNGFQHDISNDWRAVILYHPLLHLPEFALGVVAGVGFTRKRLVLRFPSHDLLLLILFASYLAITSLPFADAQPAKILAVAPLLPMIYILAHSRGIIATLLGSKLFVVLGEISYGIYILHWPVWDWLELLGITRIFSGWLLLFPYLSTLFAASALSYYFIERPLRRKIRLAWSRRQQRAKDLQLLTSKTSVGERRIN
jgi:peptidoglycan/LPS O-acetylase OafA/YrhL